MTLANQISNLSDAELLHQLASACGWEVRQEGACIWYVNPREGGKLVSGAHISHDHTVQNGLRFLEPDQDVEFVNYVDDRTVTRYDMITASARLKAEGILYALSKFP
jgi:hypothetical protein